MTLDTLTIGSKLGGICLLNTRQALRQTVFDAAAAVGCGSYVPAQPARTTVLRECMKNVADEMYGRRRKRPIVIRQLNSPDSFEAVRVIPGQSQNKYEFLFSAQIDTHWNASILEYTTDGPFGYVVLAKLDAAIAQMRDYLPGPVISRVVVKMLTHWKAVPLKEDGGAWFIDGAHVEDYKSFAATVRGPNADGPRFTVTMFQIDNDPDTVMHVLDRLGEEVAAGMKEIMDDVLAATGGMADRSINVRLNRANAFLDKVQTYERILGKPLPDLTDSIEQVKQAVAVNRLLSASV